MGIIISFGSGLANPYIASVMGNMTNVFSFDKSKDELFEEGKYYAVGFLIVGLGFFVIIFLSVLSWIITSER